MEAIKLTEILLTPNSLTLAAAIIALLFFAGKIPIPTGHDKKIVTLSESRVWRFVLPVLPPIIGVIAAFMPGVTDIPLNQWGSLIIFGLWTGFVAAQSRNIIKRGIFDDLGKNK